jgi:hypothetical protein
LHMVFNQVTNRGSVWICLSTMQGWAVPCYSAKGPWLSLKTNKAECNSHNISHVFSGYLKSKRISYPECWQLRLLLFPWEKAGL